MAHVLFDHDFLMPICSTGIDEKIYKENLELILKIRDHKKQLSTYQTILKRKFLRSIYGSKNVDMKNVWQDAIFKQNLENYHKHLFTRLIHIKHDEYDKWYESTSKLMKQIESKGLIMSRQ